MAVSFSTENMSPPPLLTDFYQISMCYGYWKAKMHDKPACFELFFRKNPFHGEFTIFGGLDDCLEFVQRFKFSETDLDFLRTVLPPSTEENFFEYLSTLNCDSLKIYGIKEGTVVFPKVPLISVEGPLAVCQLLETTFLNLINFSSLVATNAARFRLAAGKDAELLEFGLRRAQGPNGGLTASKYCYMGGFDATSNVLAGKLYNIPVKGTQAHSFICSFSSAADMQVRELKSNKNGEIVDFFELCKIKLKEIVDSFNWGISIQEISEGELAAFCAYAIAFPETFLALIDTYDVLRSGVINFIAVSLVLHDLGYRALGCRIDSGDLSYLSKEIRVRFKQIADMNSDLEWFALTKIIASNDINEETIMSLNDQKHEINSFGVGTHLVTCQKQPALGCVYKLVAVSGLPKIKLSQEVVKITIPGRKKCYRLYSKDGRCLLDLLTLHDEEAPAVNTPILCRHPFEESRRAYASPGRVEALHDLVWSDGKIVCERPSLLEMKQRVTQTLNELRGDHKRYLNPTPYKVSVTENLYHFLHTFWLQHAPIGQLE